MSVHLLKIHAIVVDVRQHFQMNESNGVAYIRLTKSLLSLSFLFTFNHLHKILRSNRCNMPPSGMNVCSHQHLLLIGGVYNLFVTLEITEVKHRDIARD